MERRIEVFVVSFITWCLLVWPYGEVSGGLDGQSIIAGLIASLIVALVFGDGLAEEPAKLLNPVRWFWLLCYIPVFVYECVKANLHVAYLVLHPEMPIRPGIVKVRTNLRSKTGITALANSITLTPGTMTVDARENGEMYIHLIDVRVTGEEEATKQIVEPFEVFLKHIIE